MTRIALPNGQVIDFGDTSPEEIEREIDTLKQDAPEFFEQRQRPQRQTVASIFEGEPRATPGAEVEEEEDIKPTHDGEVTDISFRTFFGRADNNEEKAARLTQAFGEGTFTQDKRGYFILDLDEIDQKQKKEFGLPSSGTIFVNKPGFTRYDIADFLGHEAVPLAASIGAGIAATGIGTLPGIGLMALAGGVGKAIDEVIIEDIGEGLQRQTNDEVLRDSLLEAVFVGAGEGIGRGIGAGIKYLTKGKGAVPDPEIQKRLEAKFLEQGLSPRQARKKSVAAAREEQAVVMSDMIDKGALIPAQTLSGKAILGRTQAIYESIFPNDALAIQNAKFMRDTLDDVKKGLLSNEEGMARIAENLEPVVQRLKDRMVNKETAYKDAKTALKTVLQGQFKGLEKAMNVAPDLDAREFLSTLDSAVNLWNVHSKNLYKLAEDQLGSDKASISLEGLKNTLEKSGLGLGKVTADEGRLATAQIERAGLQDVAGREVFNLIRENNEVKITDIPALKAAIRAMSSDPKIQKGPADNLVGKLIDDLDTELNAKVVKLSVENTDSGIKEGIEALRKANDYYSEGIQTINSGMLNSLRAQIQNGYIGDMTGVVQAMVRPNQPNILKQFFKTLEPSNDVTAKLIKVRQSDRPNLLEDAALLVEEGKVKEANKLLRNKNLLSNKDTPITKKTKNQSILEMNEAIEGLPAEDFTRQTMLADYAKTLRDYDNLSKRNTNPEQFTDEFRDRMARQWIHQNSRMKDGKPDLPSLARNFDDLGQATQKELFGKRYDEVKELMKDFRLVGYQEKELAEAAQRLSSGSSTVSRMFPQLDEGTAGISGILSKFSEDMARVKLQGEDALFKALDGQPFNSDDLVQHVMKNPNSIDRLKRELINQPEAIREIEEGVIARLLPSKVTSDLGEAIQSGEFNKAVADNLKKLNTNGAVTKILGDDLVNDLRKIGQAGDIISDSVMKGKTGLAAAGYAAAFGTSLLMSPLATLTGAAAILGISKALRSKPVMKYLTSPRLRAYEAERAMAAGAELGPRNLALEKQVEAAKAAIRQITLQLGAYGTSSGAEAVSGAAQPMIEEATEAATPVVNQARSLNLPDTTPGATMLPGQQPPTRGGMTVSEIMRGIEEDKLVGR